MHRTGPLWGKWRAAYRVDVVGLGQCALDRVAVVDGPPQFTGKKRIVELLQFPGGQIATAVLACARLGLRAALLSAVGEDAAREIILEPLRAAGVDLAGVRVVPGAESQLSVIVVDRKSGERTVLWHRDPRLSMSVRELRRDEIETFFATGDLNVLPYRPDYVFFGPNERELNTGDWRIGDTWETAYRLGAVTILAVPQAACENCLTAPSCLMYGGPNR